MQSVFHSSVTFDPHLCMEAISCSDKMSLSHSHIHEVRLSTVHDEERDLHRAVFENKEQSSGFSNWKGATAMFSTEQASGKPLHVINKLHVLRTVTMYHMYPSFCHPNSLSHVLCRWSCTVSLELLPSWTFFKLSTPRVRCQNPVGFLSSGSVVTHFHASCIVQGSFLGVVYSLVALNTSLFVSRLLSLSLNLFLKIACNL